MYDAGNGLAKDLLQAANWYRKAAQQGNSLAQLAMGDFYKEGHGLSKDIVQAYMWYSLAASQGEKGAAKILEDLQLQMTPTQITEAKRLANAFRPEANTERKDDLKQSP